MHPVLQDSMRLHKRVEWGGWKRLLQPKDRTQGHRTPHPLSEITIIKSRASKSSSLQHREKWKSWLAFQLAWRGRAVLGGEVT